MRPPDICIVALTTGEVISIGDEGQYEIVPHWSPDGRYLVYASKETESLWVVSVDGKQRFQLTEPGSGDEAPCWAR